MPELNQYAAAIDDTFLLCRTFGHRWVPFFDPTMSPPPWGVRVSLKCDCGMLRHDIIDSIGALSTRSYVAPEDYALPGLALEERPKRSDFRLSFVERFRRTTNPAASPTQGVMGGLRPDASCSVSTGVKQQGHTRTTWVCTPEGHLPAPTERTSMPGYTIVKASAFDAQRGSVTVFSDPDLPITMSANAPSAHTTVWLTPDEAEELAVLLRAAAGQQRNQAVPSGNI